MQREAENEEITLLSRYKLRTLAIMLLLLTFTGCGMGQDGRESSGRSVETDSSSCPFTAADMTNALGESIDAIPEEQGTCQFRRRSTTSAGPIPVYRNDGDLTEKKTEVIRAGYDQIVEEPQVGPGCFRGNNNAYAYASTLAVYYVCDGWEFGITVKSAQQSEQLDVAAKYLAGVF